MSHLIPTILLAVGASLVLLFLFSPHISGSPGPLGRIPRWVFLTDGMGIILCSRAFAVEPIHLGLVGAGMVLLAPSAFFNWRFIVARWRKRAVADGEGAGAPR